MPGQASRSVRTHIRTRTPSTLHRARDCSDKCMKHRCKHQSARHDCGQWNSKHRPSHTRPARIGALSAQSKRAWSPHPSERLNHALRFTIDQACLEAARARTTEPSRSTPSCNCMSNRQKSDANLSVFVTRALQKANCTRSTRHPPRFSIRFKPGAWGVHAFT